MIIPSLPKRRQQKKVCYFIYLRSFFRRFNAAAFQEVPNQNYVFMPSSIYTFQPHLIVLELTVLYSQVTFQPRNLRLLNINLLKQPILSLRPVHVFIITLLSNRYSIQPRDQLTLLRFFVVFPSPTKKNAIHLKAGNSCISLPNLHSRIVKLL